MSDFSRWYLKTNKDYYESFQERGVRVADPLRKFLALEYLRLLSPYLYSGSKFIVEIGGGTGCFFQQFLTYLQKLFPDVYESTTYVTLDFSRRCCESQKTVLGKHRVDVMNAEAGSVVSLPYRSNSIDGYIVNEVFDDLPVEIVRQNGDLLIARPPKEVPHIPPGEFMEGEFKAPSEEEKRWIVSYCKRYEVKPKGGLVVYSGMDNSLKEIARTLKPRGWVVGLDYFEKGPKVPLQEDFREGNFNLTVPIDPEIFRKACETYGLKLLYFKFLPRVFRRSEIGRIPVKYDENSGLVQETKDGIPLYKFLMKALKESPYKYYVFILRKVDTFHG